MKTLPYVLIAIFLGAIGAVLWTIFIVGPNATNNTKSIKHVPNTNVAFAQEFRRDNLKTNTAIASIPLREVLDGGPGKDGIPAINDPQFESIADAATWLTPESRGILFARDNEIRFYPYAILYWHEIVNDTVGDTPIAITFCPLCGTAIAFDRRVSTDTLMFGVSGKLYQSNLLMYDANTESLWSQARATALVGDMTDTQLKILKSDLTTFGDIQTHHPTAQILSRDTGHRRNYNRTPYGDYESNTQLVFPTDSFDAKFHPKELFIVAPLNTESAIGFHFADLRSSRTATITHNNADYTATYTDSGTVTITDNIGAAVPHYTTMYFSWAVHDDRNKSIWSADKIR